MDATVNERIEWLEADGLGGFASGTATGVRTRRYHALLLSAANPPVGRQVLVAGMDVETAIDGRTCALSSQRYAPNVIHPDGVSRLESFGNDPWPRWTFKLETGATIEQELFVPKGLPATVIRWRLAGRHTAATLSVRPFIAGRDYHSTTHANDAFRSTPEQGDGCVRWAPYEGVQQIVAGSNGSYRHAFDWYRNFLYAEELARGLDAVEDLACPGVFEFDLASGDAVLVLAAATADTDHLLRSMRAERLARDLEVSERERRRSLGGMLERAADAYVVRRGSGSTIVAGYPWFTDWGRDTFISLRGLCLATGRLAEARQILLAWAGAVSEGMLPNRFTDGGEAPEFNAVDASLWFIVAAHEYLEADASATTADRRVLRAAIESILDGYSRGTRYGIRADGDGLLAAGAPGLQLTWMDARVGDRVITPRVGKPVEIQALWINALWIAAHHSRRWEDLFARACASFERRFWNEQDGALYDVVDVDHQAGAIDASFRPNQIFAVGGLPLGLIDGERGRRIVDAVHTRLWTPAGLRSLAPGEPGYQGQYTGGVAERDGAYHQGTVWPWLLGPFVEAWLRTRPDPASAKDAARGLFLEPFLARLPDGPRHIPEVAGGDPPHAPGGCPFQAWSVAEILRLDRSVLAVRRETVRPRRHRSAQVRT
jgi:predicted glycogen debranching enzyme